MGNTNFNIVAIVQSFLRPQNIQRICETILEIQTVDLLIVSNNNPDINIVNFLQIKDNRLKIITQKRKSGSIKRFEIARTLNAKIYFSIDDDLFLTGQQIKYLIKKLVECPNVVHGFWGMNYKFDNKKLHYEFGINNLETRVDIINRAYFFTKNHVSNFFKLIQSINVSLIDVNICDDMLLSFSGVDKPCLHSIGDFIDCPTSNEPGIALWREVDFFIKREAILFKILKFKKLIPM